MATYWGGRGWCYGGWAGGSVLEAEALDLTAKRGTLTLQSGGILNLISKGSVLDIHGTLGHALNVFEGTAKRGTLTITGLQGAAASFAGIAKRASLSMLGYSSTSGDFAIVAKHGTLSIKQLSILWGCTALCLDNVANSDYDNFEFDSFAVKDGYVLAANSAGVYVLSGSDDDGTEIDITIETAQSDLGAGELKSVPDVYVTYNGGPVVVKAINQSNVRTGYEVEATTKMQTKRARVGQGLEQLLWGIRLENQDGALTDVDRIELRPYGNGRV
jgi:hypothetical protein